MSQEVEAAITALDAGRVVVVPTETVYGLAARIDRPEAIEKIFELKERPTEKVLQVLVADGSWLPRLAEATPAARALAAEFWPGSLTLVVSAKPSLPDATMKDGKVGIRVPDHPSTRAVIEAAGPLAASSANVAGEPTPARIDGLRAIFGDRVAAYIDGGTIVGSGSTVVDVSRRQPVLVREGPVAFAEIRDVCDRASI